MKINRSVLQTAVIYVLIGTNLFLMLFGCAVLLRSPYTGIRLSPRGKQVCVANVDQESPGAREGIKPGDALISINGIQIPSFVSSYEPNHLSSRKEQRAFWEFEKKLGAELETHRQIALLIERDGRQTEIFLTPDHFPLSVALSRVLLIYLVAWTFIILPILVLRKKQHEISVANFIIGAFGAMISLSFPPYCLRDLAFPYYAFRILTVFSYSGLMISTFACIHLLLVFPRRKKMLMSKPWLIPAVYTSACAIMIAEFAGVFSYPHLTTYVPMVLCLAVFVGGLIYDFVRERNPIYKKQAQWVVFGFAVSCGWALLNLVYIIFNVPLFPAQLVVLPTVIFPVSLAFAITRYRLMDIDTIFDSAVVFGAILIILEGAELAFLGAVSPLYQNAAYLRPTASLFAVLLIVVLYMPLRNGIKRAVERIFKRGTYAVEEELRAFTQRLAQCDNSSSLDKFAAYVKERLGPSGLCFLHFDDNQAPDVVNTGLRTQMAAVSAEISNSDHFNRNPHSYFGYELADNRVLTGFDPGAPVESSLFVPFFVERKLSHIAVLLPKWNNTAYSKKDKALLDALSVSISHVLEAEEKREAAERERLRLAREIHDGIGQEFTGIISYSEKAEVLTAAGREQNAMAELLGSISASARRGIQELRSIIWALNPERQTLGYLSSYIKRSVGDLLSNAGIRISMNGTDPENDVPLPPHIALAAYRIVQECSHNAVKHSGADKVNISFGAARGWLELVFSDNGKGFDVHSSLSGAGNGLKNMKKRVDEAGGEIIFDSFPGGGAKVKVKLPIG